MTPHHLEHYHIIENCTKELPREPAGAVRLPSSRISRFKRRRDVLEEADLIPARASLRPEKDHALVIVDPVNLNPALQNKDRFQNR